MKTEHGYTIIEILVALTLVSIILGLASSAFIFSSRQLVRWSDGVRFNNEAHISGTVLYQDLLGAEEIVLSDSLLVLKKDLATEIQYDRSGVVLSRNDSPLSEEADNLTIKYISIDPETRLLSLTLKIETGRNKLVIDQLFHLRKPEKWKPIRELN